MIFSLNLYIDKDLTETNIVYSWVAQNSSRRACPFFLLEISPGFLGPRNLSNGKRRDTKAMAAKSVVRKFIKMKPSQNSQTERSIKKRKQTYVFIGWKEFSISASSIIKKSYKKEVQENKELQRKL